jgi:bifunctional non-homologous end joining protein LigD
VSTPLEWHEVDAKLDPKKFTLRTILRRLAKKKKDPILEVLSAKPDLGKALERLAAYSLSP